MSDAISAYGARLDPRRAEICAALRGSIDEMLPKATSRLWHGIPVWFVGENPVVGYTARKTGVMLMFWNGQHFDEPELAASGSFHMAQIPYESANDIDRVKLAGWLQKAGTSIWDMVGERNAFVAKRRAKKAKASARAKKASKNAAPKKAPSRNAPPEKSKTAKRKPVRAKSKK
jgi:hypothetical protein